MPIMLICDEFVLNAYASLQADAKTSALASTIAVILTMGLRMSPSKMLVAKVVTHKDLERKMILALEEFGLFEPIDVRMQAGILQAKRTGEEETVFTSSDRINAVIESLSLNTSRGSSLRTEVQTQLLSESLEFVTDVVKSVESEVVDTDSELATLTLELERQRGIYDIALAMGPLGLDLGMMTTTEYTYTSAGRIEAGRLSKLEWSLKEVTEGAYAFKAVPARGGNNMMVASVSVPCERKDAADRIFTAIGYETFQIPEGSKGDPEATAMDALAQITQLEKEIARLEDRKQMIAREWGSRILAAWEVLEIEKSRASVKSYFVYTESSVKAWGWIPAEKQERLQEILTESVGSALSLAFDEPDFSETDSPTYLDNPPAMKSAEDVVTAYGVPAKDDIDPTKILWLSFPLIFGLVFADVGQGFLILLIGLAAVRATRRGDDWGQIMGYIQNGGVGLVLMGIFAIVGGFLFGSFFGSETVIQAQWPIFEHYLANGEPNTWRAVHLLKLSIEVGVIQISLGIILDIYNKFKHGKRDSALASICYLWLYLGFIILLFGVSYSNVSSWFSNTGTVNLWLPIVGIGSGMGNNGVYPTLPISPMSFSIIAFFVPFILMALLSFKHGMDGAVHFLENALGMISHTVSYARIFALNTVHVILSSVFFSFDPGIITLYFPPVSLLGLDIIPAQFVEHGAVFGAHLPMIGAVIGTLIVGILEGMLAFMHTLRLHFVEWFSKFYHAGGVAFAPFSARRIFTTPAIKIAVAPPIAVN